MKCAIALGSNLSNNFGSCQEIVEAAIKKLGQIPQIQVLRVSRWYQTTAVTLGDIPQPDYINGCAILATSFSPHELLEVLLEIEVQLGRVRRAKWDARTLDLDLLLYEDYILNSDNLIIPHPRMSDRLFVMAPLAEIAPDWTHPMLGDRLDKLMAKLVDKLNMPPP
jgi:2-amino-4-hydroxy-6-hydroxymethyldihydropteridine diphosphokinase